MSSGIGGDNTGCGGGEAPFHVLPVLEGVLPIRGIDGSTGEAIPMGTTLGLREAGDPYRTDVVRWAAMDMPSIMKEEDLTRLKEEYRIPEDIELIIPGPNERACFPRRGCTALHLNAFVSGMRLPLHPMFRRILRAYDLAPTQVAPNGWSQMVGGMYLWFRHSFGMEMPLHVFQSVYQPRKLPRKKGKEEEVGPLPRCELSRENIDVLRSIYEADRRPKWIKGDAPVLHLQNWRSRGRGHWCLALQRIPRRGRSLKTSAGRGNKEVAEASKVIEVDDAPEAEVPLSRKRKARPSGVGPSQAMAEAVEIADLPTASSVPPLQRTLAVNTAGKVILEGPPKSTPAPESGSGGPYDSKRRLRELIGSSGARIPDDSLQNVPFYPSMGAQAVKYYFTPKWEEFSSHGELEDVLEASMASAIRASTLQMKVLGEFRTRMREQKKLVAQSSKADKEHQQAIEGLKAALESARTAYEQMEADLKKSDSNLLNMTKQLDNANAAQKVATEALEAVNIEKRRLLEEAKSREEVVSSLRKELADAEMAKQRAEEGKKEVEAKLANAEVDFVANFHNTEAYSNFSDYFARVGHQEVLTALRNDHPEVNVKDLEARFPPPDAEGEEDN
ncbi:Uncharacterized protein Adt_26987 [Abeliophyllum distichum]|uniref:Transposase (putative) gypsy type domain-containing protein n=1 Tax=Abeliophyllum distichum TaxID=126358 RepID=A0ABD1RSF9_9LAMI